MKFLVFGFIRAYSVQSRITDFLTNLDMQIKFSSFLNYWSDFPHKSHSHSPLRWIVEEARNKFVSLSLGISLKYRLRISNSEHSTFAPLQSGI